MVFLKIVIELWNKGATKIPRYKLWNNFSFIFKATYLNWGNGNIDELRKDISYFSKEVFQIFLLSKSFKVNCLPRANKFSSIFSNSSIDVFLIRPVWVLTGLCFLPPALRIRNNLKPWRLLLNKLNLEVTRIIKIWKKHFAQTLCHWQSQVKPELQDTFRIVSF